MKKQFQIFLVFFCFAGNLYSQDGSMELHPLSGINFKRPVLVNHTANSYVVMDQPDTLGTALYFIGKDYKLLKKTDLPARVYTGKFISANDQTVLLWPDKQKDSLKLNQLCLDQHGEKLSFKQTTIPAYRHLINDKKNRHYFFFSVFTDSLHHLIIDGVLLDTALNKLNTVLQSLDFNEDLDRVCGPILDAAGNIHTVIYDRLTNYRESVNVRINTIPATENAVVTESFQFDKVKFYDMIFFENTADQQVQLAGFYYDGNSKIKKGLASIQFPYERVNKVIPKFNLISEQQRIYLASGMKNLRKRNDVLDYLKLKDIVEKDGQVIISAWLLDIPANLIIKDREQEYYDNGDIATWLRSGRDDPYGYRSGPTTNIPLPIDAINPPLPYAQFGDISSTQVGVRSYTYARPVRKNTTVQEKKSFNNSGIKQPSVTPYKIKIMFASMDKQGFQKWMQLAPGDFPVKSASYRDQLSGYPLIENEQLYFTQYSPLKARNNINSGIFTGNSLITINELGITNKPFTFEQSEELIFYKPNMLSKGKYLSVYNNPVTQQSGLAVLQIAVQ